ncbi:hypothetical protein ACFW04_013190 [Cataglyphis niger]
MSDMTRELKGWWREEMKNMKEEVKEGIRERVSEEMDKVRKEFRESEKRWVEEREEFNRRIKGLKKGEQRVAVEELFDSIGIKAEIEEVRKIGGSVEEGREMIVVRLKNEDQKREVWNKKKLLKSRKERILEDWTWKERRMRWSLERIVKKEEKKAGIKNKNRDFWREVEEWDVVMLSETWLDRKGWDSARGYLPKAYRWKVQLAERRNKKGRAIGGMLLGIKKELKVEEVKVIKRNGLLEVELKVEDRKWNVIGVYVRGDLEKKLEELSEWMERKEENGCILIGGTLTQEQEEGVGRRSRDKRINKEGKELLRWIEKAGWTIFNGCTKGDIEEEWTYTGGSGNSVIDYVMGDEDTRMQVGEVEVGDNIDHHPIIKGEDGKCYREAKGKYKKLIEGKKKEEKERWENEVREIKTEGQVWELVNRGRRRRRKVNEDISMEEWDGYFRNLLGGSRAKIDEEESISRSEIRAVIGRLKDNKAVGTDGIPAEVWKYGGENMEEWIWKICNRIWKGEDLKAAFDSVDRRKLVEAMRERGVREELIRRSENIMRETRNRVRRGEDLGTGFWTGRGVRQGYPLSPHLFNLITADMEKVMSRGGWRGVRLGGIKVYTLAYADDVVLIAEEEEGMRSMIGKLEGYLEKKELELNVGKSKILRFRKEGGRDRKVSWRWKGKVIEEVKEFSYLGYMMQRNGEQEAQIRDRAGRRAWGFEKKLEEGRGSGIARRCWEELREKSRRKIDLSKWEEERCRYFEDRGMGMVKVEAKRSEEVLDFGYFVKKDREMDEKERWERIEESRYNSLYREIKGSGIPEYLRRDWGESRWQRMARYRLEWNQGNWYWKEEEDKKCRLCGREEEVWEHVWKRCELGGGEGLAGDVGRGTEGKG